MQSRRKFLIGGAAGIAGLGLNRSALGQLTRAQMAPPSAFGVQLYTVRNQIKADPAGVLAAIRKIGYRSVETFAAQYANTSAKDLRAMIVGADLLLPSAHFGYGDLGSRFGYAHDLGVQYMVCGATPTNVADSADGFKRAAQQYNQWGSQAKALGMRFAFHNHDTEFVTFDGVTGLEIMLKETDPELVQWQMDCYWVTQAGSDPVALLKRYASRMQTIHVKDRKPGFPSSTVTGPTAQHFTEVGHGTLNWPAIWAAAEAAGVRYFFVEQDTTEIPPLQSLQVSYDYLKSHI